MTKMNGDKCSRPCLAIRIQGGKNNMYSVGIDVSKGKSTVCIIDCNGSTVYSPFEVKHEKDDLERLLSIFKNLAKKEDIKVVMEATGIYHWPIFKILKDNDYFVCVVNPLKMKAFSKNVNFRSVKTDKIDSTIISRYGVEKWISLKNDNYQSDSREELKRLTRAYEAYQKPKVNIKQIMDSELEKAMPGIKSIIDEDDKLCDFILEFKHFDKIKKMTSDKFVNKFNAWKKKKNYLFHSVTPIKIYDLAIQAIPTVPYDDVCKTTMESSIYTLRSINKVLNDILAQANTLAKKMPEYQTVRQMTGVGDKLAPLLIAEIGDIRLLRSKKSLVCMAGIDVPPYESGQFKANKRSITKKGNSHIRRNLYLVMTSLIKNKPKDDNDVYLFIQRKREDDNKHFNVALVAGMRKFLHIYYARLKELSIKQGIWAINS